MAVKPKPYPKSLGACADLLFDLRAKRLELDKAAAVAKEAETTLINHIIDSMDKESTGASGKHHAVRVVTKQKPQVKDWPAFYAYIAKTKAFDMVQRRLGEAAVLDRCEFKEVPDPDNPGEFKTVLKKAPPGVEMFNAVTVSLTKV